MRNTNYAPSTDLYHVAPTAVIPGKGLLVGKAFDPMSYLYNSTTGHAGIFSSATDTLRLFRLMLAGGQLDSEARMFQKATIDSFTTITVVHTSSIQFRMTIPTHLAEISSLPRRILAYMVRQVLWHGLTKQRTSLLSFLPTQCTLWVSQRSRILCQNSLMRL
jgi:CubicO group peptidase (beta-lactamase class C family)